ncbi:30S ribosomal protein S16 [Patescibacteria group bacterium]|jgi:small subunit ribosomal protein S16|nr:30S ribosomal protein S16 [Patescibacteria group bacterium]HPD07847.1 30S ribosomal protein S16 [bacterium]HRT11238.1 30S ribosomal protein S16 [Patescibacteria group bacterium]HRU90021.1 30S ribosomal protein S16 [Patescibacteria group bacterium]
MLKIKLARIGKKKSPVYRLIISEAGRDPYGRILENLGSYNPKTKDLQVKAERINYWLNEGAQMTITVNNLLVGHKIVTGNIIKIRRQQPVDQNKNKNKENDHTDHSPAPGLEPAVPSESDADKKEE